MNDILSDAYEEADQEGGTDSDTSEESQEVNDNNESSEESQEVDTKNETSEDGQEVDAKNESSEESQKIDPRNEVPEDGVYSFSMPEGVDLDKDLADEVSLIFKDKGFTQDEAQGMVDLYIEQRQKEMNAFMDMQANKVKEWRAELESDKEFGGENFNSNVNAVKKMLDTYGGQDVKDIKSVLTESGLGNHPGIIKMLWRMSKATAEDSVPDGADHFSNKKRSALEILYGD